MTKLDEQTIVNTLSTFQLAPRQRRFLVTMTDGLPKEASLYLMDNFIKEYIRGEISEHDKKVYTQCAFDRAKLSVYILRHKVLDVLHACRSCYHYDGMGECDKFQSRPPNEWIESKNDCSEYVFYKLNYNDEVGFYFADGKKEDAE